MRNIVQKYPSVTYCLHLSKNAQFPRAHDSIHAHNVYN